ncbi:MAG: hypothetical protein Kow0098_22100 [Ignavibacteriaceae bacterium]
MIVSSKFFRLSMIFGFLVLILVLVFGYIFFEQYLTENVVTIKVVNSAKFGDIPGRYLVFTPEEVFENSNSYYNNKSNADELYFKLLHGRTYKVKVVGIYLPWLPRFRNILEIVEEVPTERVIN